MRRILLALAVALPGCPDAGPGPKPPPSPTTAAAPTPSTATPAPNSAPSTAPEPTAPPQPDGFPELGGPCDVAATEARATSVCGTDGRVAGIYLGSPYGTEPPPNAEVLVDEPENF